MIKVIFFDSGNVLFEEGYRPAIQEYEEKHNITPGQLYEAAHGSVWKKFTLGDVSEREYLNDLKENFDGKVDTNELIKLINNKTKSNNELLDFIRELKKKFKIGIISNNPREWFERYEKKFSWGDLFEVKVVSSYLHIRKPNVEIFSKALDMAKVKAGEAVYVDDRFDRVQGAENLGMNVVIYEGVKQLKETLNQLIQCL